MEKTQRIWMLLDILHKSVNSGYPEILAWARAELHKLNAELSPEQPASTSFPGENLEDPELDLEQTGRRI